MTGSSKNAAIYERMIGQASETRAQSRTKSIGHISIRHRGHGLLACCAKFGSVEVVELFWNLGPFANESDKQCVKPFNDAEYWHENVSMCSNKTSSLSNLCKIFFRIYQDIEVAALLDGNHVTTSPALSKMEKRRRG